MRVAELSVVPHFRRGSLELTDAYTMRVERPGGEDVWTVRHKWVPSTSGAVLLELRVLYEDVWEVVCEASGNVWSALRLIPQYGKGSIMLERASVCRSLRGRKLGYLVVHVMLQKHPFLMGGCKIFCDPPRDWRAAFFTRCGFKKLPGAVAQVMVYIVS